MHQELLTSLRTYEGSHLRKGQKPLRRAELSPVGAMVARCSARRPQGPGGQGKAEGVRVCGAGESSGFGSSCPAPWVTWRRVFSSLVFPIYSEPFLLGHVALGGSYVQRPLKVSVCGWFTPEPASQPWWPWPQPDPYVCLCFCRNGVSRKG